MIKNYAGRRFSAGETIVEVHEGENTRDLPIRLDICNHSPTGFEWGYPGSGPAQLALAILADFTGNAPEPRVYQKFKAAFIQHINEDRWIIIGATIQKFLNEDNPNGDLDAFLQD